MPRAKGRGRQGGRGKERGRERSGQPQGQADKPYELERRVAVAQIQQQQVEAARKVNIFGKFIISDVKKIMTETCWAVSIAEVVEAHHNKLHGDKKWLYLELSPRFLTNSINSPYDALSSFTKASKLMRETGIPLEKDFPFSLGPDVKPPKKLMGKIVRIGKAFEANGSDQRIEEESVRTLLDSDLGPVVLVFKTDKSFHHLRPEEIYDTPAELFDAKGHSNLRHHAVVALGYGELDNNPYWYVRNCHGEKWCNAGCGMVSRNLEIQKVWYPKEIKI